MRVERCDLLGKGYKVDIVVIDEVAEIPRDIWKKIYKMKRGENKN